MKQKLLTTTKTLITILAVVAMTGIASAWTAPTGTAPSGNVPAPVNTGAVTQTKNGSLVINNGYFGVAGVFPAGVGYFQSLIAAPKAVFGCPTGAPLVACAQNMNGSPFLFSAQAHNASGVATGGFFVDSFGTPQFNKKAPLINLETNNGPSGRDALTINVSPDNVANGDGAVFRSTADRFSLYQVGGTGNGLAALTAKKIRLTDGAAAGKVLTSMDASGNAVWGDSTGGTPIQTESLIKYARVEDGQGSSVAAYCGTNQADDANWIVVGGGGDCQFGTRSSQPVTNRSNALHGVPSSTTPAIGWRVTCLGAVGGLPVGSVSGVGGVPGQVKAEAICMKRIALATPAAASVPANPTNPTNPTDPTPPPPAPPVQSWHPLATVPNPPADPAQNGSSCNAWLAGTTYASNSKSALLITGAFTHPIFPAECAYQFDAPVWSNTQSTSPGGSTALSNIYSTCQHVASSFSRSDAKPVKSCSVTNASNNMGATGISAQVKTQVLY